MGSKIATLLAGTGGLVALYLILTNGKNTVSIISQLGGTYSQGVKTLQGR